MAAGFIDGGDQRIQVNHRPVASHWRYHKKLNLVHLAMEFNTRGKFENTNGVISSHKSKDSQMKKGKQWSAKHFTENYRLNNTNCTKNRGWTQVQLIYYFNMWMLIQLPYVHGEDSLYMYYTYEKKNNGDKNIMNQTWRRQLIIVLHIWKARNGE